VKAEIVTRFFQLAASTLSAVKNAEDISKLAFYFFTFQGFSAFSGFYKKSKVRK